QVLMVDLQEAKRRLPLAEEVQDRHGPGAGGAESREGDAAQGPHLPPTVGVDPRADLCIGSAFLECGAVIGIEEGPRVVADGLEDAEAREKLEIGADSEEPACVRQVVLFADDVRHDRSRVERRLVGADRQRWIPGVIRDSWVLETRGARLTSRVEG